MSFKETLNETPSEAHSALAEITNFEALTDTIGTSGQPTAQQFQDIAAAGYGSVINLALPTSDHALADEGSIVTGLGMNYFHVPVAFDAPTLADLRTFVGLMRTLQGDSVWVHCVVNARVSAFMYLYLRHVEQLPDAAARSTLLERWEPKMDAIWKAFLATAPERFVP